VIQFLALLSLLKRLMSKELRDVSSVGLNNLLFCILFLMSGSFNIGRPRDAFWSTVFFQLVILGPLLVIFSVDTQHRLPPQRVATWPLTDRSRFLLSAISFALNPLFLVLFIGYLAWMGFAVALGFLLLALAMHGTVYAIGRLSIAAPISWRLRIPRAPVSLGGIVQETAYELTATLDFWTALLVALCGTLYRLFDHAADLEAFPILALFVGIAMSTVAQRMMSLDEGRAHLRYRLLPIAGWKLLLAQDATFLLPLLLMVSFLNLRTGLAFGLMALATGRYPSLRQPVSQRRWRFTSGTPRFGAAQIVLGGVAGIGAARAGVWVLPVVCVLYVASLFWGDRLWKHA